MLDEVYVRYLRGQDLGHLATLGPDGPRVKPVGFRYNEELGTLDVGAPPTVDSPSLGRPASVALVVDDAPGEGAVAGRFLEVRGEVEQVLEAGSGEDDAAVIRIRPRRVLGWNVDPDHPGLEARDLDEGAPLARPHLESGGSADWGATAAAERLIDELGRGADGRDARITDTPLGADSRWGSPFGATVEDDHERHRIHTRRKEEGRGGRASRSEAVQVVAPVPGVVVAQVRRTALGPDGRPIASSGALHGAFPERALYVLVRRHGAWRLAASQNTPVRPPRRH